MIHIFFVPGMFGSTIEYIIRSYSNELAPVSGKILADGSLHSFRKQAHFTDIEYVNNFFKSDNTIDVTTPIYPFREQKLPEILKNFDQTAILNDACVLIHADSIESAELNMLFQYHKISVGLNQGLDIFCRGNEHNIKSWNSTYNHWPDMEIWQLREWVSLFYVPWAQEWIESAQQVSQQFLTVKNTDFLSNPVNTTDRIFSHCDLTQKSGLSEFLNQWKQAQQYIVDEYNLLGHIVDCSIANQNLSWEPINLIAEAIVQQRLRANGYEIQCDGLNTFPTNAETLYKLLEKV